MVWASGGYQPTQMTVACPACRGPALFRRARGLRLHSDEARARLEALPYFKILNDGHGAPIAVYRYGLGAPLPENIPESTPDEARTLPMSGPWPPHDIDGSVVCETCGHRAAHRVDWPAEAYFAVEHRGQFLWAWNRPLAEALAAYLAAPDAKAHLAASPAKDFLKRVPTFFLTAQNRDAVAKKLRRLLES